MQALIDLDKPVAILLVAVLHFIGDEDDPRGIVDQLKATMPAGSYLVLSHVTADDVSGEVSQKVRSLYDRATAPACARTRSEIERLFDGLEITEPGLVDVCGWRTEWMPPEPARTIFYAAVGRKP